MSILITRPEPQNTTTSLYLKNKGLDVLSCPLTSIHFFQTNAPSHYDYIIITSLNALLALKEQTWYLDKQKPIITIGQKTAEELKIQGFQNIILTNQSTAHAIPQTLAQNQLLQKQGLRLKGEHEHFNLAELINENGGKINTLELYSARAITALPPHILECIINNQIHAVFHYSLRALECLVELSQAHNVHEILSEIYHICISSTISNKSVIKGWNKTSVAQEISDKSMYDAYLKTDIS